MNSRDDEVKALWLQQEGELIDNDVVDALTACVTNDLIAWANSNIFTPLNGELTLRILANGPPNACAITYWDRIYRPTIAIQLSLLREIYRDAFTFPLISKRIETETDNIKNLHDSYELFKDMPFTFNSGIPAIPASFIRGNLKLHCLACVEVAATHPNPYLTTNDIFCRFLMFEVMLAWTFFHELGHIVQRHFMLGETKAGVGNASVEISEMSGSDTDTASNIKAQGREILADTEGLDLTLKYMARKGIYGPVSLYLLLCAQSCMFNRFYGKSAENLEPTAGKHPHPSIRDDFAHAFLMQWVIAERKRQGVIQDASEIAPPLVYMSVRSSFMAGLFWAHRLEKFDGSGLPSYMRLSTPEHDTQRKSYRTLLLQSIKEQLPFIKDMHLLPSNAIPLFEVANNLC